MATTDTIVFVKEAKTCSYVLIVHTPRLCGEPGFMSSKDAGEQAAISCREIVAGEAPDRSDAAFLPDADYPLKMPRRKPVLPLAPPKLKDASAATGQYSPGLRKALDTIREQWGSGEIQLLDDGDGNLVIQFLEQVDGDEDQDAIEAAAMDRIAQALREVGMDIKMPGKSQEKKKKGDEKHDENDAADRRREVD